MITKSNVGLVIDANIVIDIVRSNPGNMLSAIFREWLTTIVGKIDIPTNGKSIVLFLSPEIKNDYVAGLCRTRQNVGKTLKVDLARRYTRSVKLDTPNRNRFIIKKIPASDIPPHRPRATDRYDRAYLDALVRLKCSNLRKDLEFIIATKDATLSASLWDETSRDTAQEFHIVDTLEDLEAGISC